MILLDDVGENWERRREKEKHGLKAKHVTLRGKRLFFLGIQGFVLLILESKSCNAQSTLVTSDPCLSLPNLLSL
jgi:hypothetical protein